MEEGRLMAFPGIMGERATSCTLLEKTRVPDGEGGWETSWTDGAQFQATIAHASSIEARVAESEGMASTFTVWTEKGVTLDFHDLFRRDSDGQVFRVTSQGGDEQSPDSASFDLQHVSAERWQL
jgi:head-tail adaptor